MKRFFVTSGKRITRRELISLLALLVVIAVGVHARAPTKYLVYVGTYTDHGSKGIYVCKFDAATGRLGAPVLAAESLEPSFLAVTTDHRFLYASNEVETFNGQATGALSAFTVNARTGKLTLLNEVSSRGAGPAHIAVDRSGHYALVANYDGGSVAALRLMPNGKIGESTAFVQHKGSSVNHERQEAPHAHEVVMSPDNRFAIVVDLGIDEVLAYPFDAANGTLGAARIVKSEAGVGPRHVAFGADEKFVYVVNELSSTITAYSYDAQNGAMTSVQSISALPDGFKGTSTAAEIAVDPSGKFLYASNRGDDSIAVFAIDSAKGTLAPVQHISTQGKTPRNFAIEPTGMWLIAANQDSNSVVTFRIDKETGRLTASGQAVEVNSPSVVAFVRTDGSGQN